LSSQPLFGNQVLMNAAAPLSAFKPHKLTVEDVLTLERGGAFVDLPRMELLDGMLYEMSPQTSRHVVAKNELGFKVRLAVIDSGMPLSVLIEPTLFTDATSAPEPDIAVLSQLRVESYYPADLVKLAVEISVTSVEIDLGYKKALYANAGIPEYWVVEVDAARIHIFWSPDCGIYRESDIIAIGKPLSSMTIPGIIIDTNGIV
jgi:Uma2 family endonuclease